MSVFKVRASGVFSAPVQKIDEDEARRALRLLADPTAGCQLFALPGRRKEHRHGNDLDGLLDGVKRLADQNHIYVVLNPLPADYEDHANNEAILRRRWIFLDIDPIKAPQHKNDPASDEEKEQTRVAAEMVRDYLASLGWPAPIQVDSGNGWYLLYQADLPNTEESTDLVRRFLRSMKPVVGERGKIDSAVCDARRIARLPGTENRKGVPSDDRPWRHCHLVSFPKELECVSREMIEGACIEPETKTHAPSANGQAKKKSVLIIKAGSDAANRYVERALDLEVAAVASAAAGGRNNRLNRAAFSLGTLIPDGYLSRAEVEARLFSAACACGLDEDPECGERGINDTIASGIKAGMKKPRRVENNQPYVSIEPPNTAPSAWGLYLDDETLAEGDAESILEPLDDSDGGENRTVFQIYTLPTLMKTRFPAPAWVVQGLLSEGLNILAGKPKMGKSVLAMNVGLTVAGGGLALGNMPVEQGDVLYLALEDKFRRLQSRAAKMLSAAGANASAHFHMATEWLRCDAGGIRMIDSWLERVINPRLVIIDVWPMFKPAPRPGSRKSAYDEDYQAFGDLKKFCDRRHVNCLVLLHCRKGLSEDVLDEVSGTLGQVGAADGIIVLNRSRSNGESKIFVCGRDVDEQELALNFDLPTLTWKSMGPSSEHLQGKLQRSIIEYLKNHQPYKASQIAEGINSTRQSVQKVLDRLLLKSPPVVRRVDDKWVLADDEEAF